MTRRTRFVAAAATLAVLVAACSSDADEGAATTPPATDAPPATEVPPATDAPVDEAPPATEAPVATEAPAPTDPPVLSEVPIDAETIEQVNEYIAEAAAFDQAGADIQFPTGLTFSAGGAPGYSRYVFREHSEGVVPSLVEGPIIGAVRCQDEASSCSYQELKALHESGDEIPDALQMTADELAELVAQLDELNAFAEAYRDVGTACADGYISDRTQTANMGSHFYKVESIVNGFDPGEPEILLYARADGSMPNGPLGTCANGEWNGEPLALVGTAFIIPPQIIGDDHPETFAGPLDNWHIHYNLCRGASEGRDSFVPRSQCIEQGGSFSEALGWMLHAWVADDYDNQLGVFGMWNSAIQPVLTPDEIRETREVQGSDFPEGAEQSIIADFLYGGELNVRTGQPLFFNNVDAVPHTVTAGTPDNPALSDFDSGLLTPGSNFELSFDNPGTYSLFCSLHPDMVASVTVTE